MLFDDEFVERLKHSPISGAIEVCDRVLDATEYDVRDAQGNLRDALGGLVEAVALIRGMVEAKLFAHALYYPELTGDVRADCHQLREFFASLLSDLHEQATRERLSLLTSRFAAQLGNQFSYEFSKGDLDRIQTLINELRDYVSSSDQFEPEHKQRLLRRLEALQGEMHKHVSDLDRFWGMVGDAGVAVGKFGKDAKPFVDRIRELTGIIWRTQARAEELPSDAQPPLLGGPED